MKRGIYVQVHNAGKRVRKAGVEDGRQRDEKKQKE